MGPEFFDECCSTDVFISGAGLNPIARKNYEVPRSCGVVETSEVFEEDFFEIWKVPLLIGKTHMNI